MSLVTVEEKRRKGGKCQKYQTKIRLSMATALWHLNIVELGLAQLHSEDPKIVELRLVQHSLRI